MPHLPARLGVWASAALTLCRAAPAVPVAPSVETVPVPGGGDAADDIAVWIHPDNPALSLVIGTDKTSGLATYNLDGSQRQFLGDGDMNNVDVRYNLLMGEQRIDVVAATNRVNDTIAIYKVDPVARTLSSAGPPIPTGLDPAYGFCMYRQPSNGAIYAVANDQDGNVKQWVLADGGSGQVVGQLVRSFSVGSQTEGMVADDGLGWLYISEESVGIWKYGAAPWAGTDRTLVDSAEGGGHLTADVEGLAVYYAARGTGYLLASSQGSSTFVVYGRGGANPYLMTFNVTSGNGIDEVTGTDGIDVANVSLGPLFPLGAFIAQDDANPGANQNFKLVRWESIALAAPQPLVIDTSSWDPRAILGDINVDGSVDVVDLLLTLTGWGPCAQCSACPADIDGNCHVTVSDLLILLTNWG